MTSSSLLCSPLAVSAEDDARFMQRSVFDESLDDDIVPGNLTSLKHCFDSRLYLNNVA